MTRKIARSRSVVSGAGNRTRLATNSDTIHVIAVASRTDQRGHPAARIPCRIEKPDMNAAYALTTSAVRATMMLTTSESRPGIASG